MTVSLLWKLLYWGWFASEVVVAIATRTRQRTGKVQDRGSLLILWVVIFTSMTACIWISDVTSPNIFSGAYAL